MKKFNFLPFCIVGLLIFATSCNSGEKVTSLTTRSIKNGHVIKKINGGRGDFLLVIRDTNGLDTIQIERQSSLFHKIDSMTTISKEAKNSQLIFHNLVTENSRYSDTIFLIDYDLPQKIE